MRERVSTDCVNKTEGITSAIINCSTADGKPDFKLELTCFNEETCECNMELLGKLAFYLINS